MSNVQPGGPVDVDESTGWTPGSIIGGLDLGFGILSKLFDSGGETFPGADIKTAYSTTTAARPDAAIGPPSLTGRWSGDYVANRGGKIGIAVQSNTPSAKPLSVSIYFLRAQSYRHILALVSDDPVETLPWRGVPNSPSLAKFRIDLSAVPALGSSPPSTTSVGPGDWFVYVFVTTASGQSDAAVTPYGDARNWWYLRLRVK
jgi:hypothetical protein